MAKYLMPRPLNARQRQFVRLYAVGPPGVKGNATAAYRGAGYRPKTDRVAQVCAAQILTNPMVQQALAHLHREADAQAIAQLKDWRTLAPPAQDRMVLLALGYLPDPLDMRQHRPLRSHTDVAIARLQLDACREIIERAYPSRLYATLEVYDPAAELARLLGVPAESLPPPDGRAAAEA